MEAKFEHDIITRKCEAHLPTSISYSSSWGGVDLKRWSNNTMNTTIKSDDNDNNNDNESITTTIPFTITTTDKNTKTHQNSSCSWPPWGYSCSQKYPARLTRPTSRMHYLAASSRTPATTPAHTIHPPTTGNTSEVSDSTKPIPALYKKNWKWTHTMKSKTSIQNVKGGTKCPIRTSRNSMWYSHGRKIALTRVVQACPRPVDSPHSQRLATFAWRFIFQELRKNRLKKDVLNLRWSPR